MIVRWRLHCDSFTPFCAVDCYVCSVVDYARLFTAVAVTPVVTLPLHAFDYHRWILDSLVAFALPFTGYGWLHTALILVR